MIVPRVNLGLRQRARDGGGECSPTPKPISTNDTFMHSLRFPSNNLLDIGLSVSCKYDDNGNRNTLLLFMGLSTTSKKAFQHLDSIDIEDRLKMLFSRTVSSHAPLQPFDTTLIAQLASVAFITLNPPTSGCVGIKSRPTAYRHRVASRRYTSGFATHTKPFVVFFSGAIPTRFFPHVGGVEGGGGWVAVHPASQPLNIQAETFMK